MVLHGRPRLILTAVTLAAISFGCRAPYLEQRISRDLERLELGMSKEEVKEILPKVYLKGQRSIDGRAVEAYEFCDLDPFARGEEEFLWFYFCDNQLVKWGKRDSWPDPPDLIIEHRNR